MDEIDNGAEARIYLADGNIVKDRVAKGYRLPIIDAQLRTARTKREAKVLARLPVSGPQLIASTATTITMSYVPGKRLRDVLDSDVGLARRAGYLLAQIHDKDIIHGDVTTSNMLYAADTDELSLIDFGLSSFSKKIEDKAVDVHLFRCALESRHTAVWERAFQLFLDGYRRSANAKAVLERFAIVEARGRNKEKP